MPRGDKLFSGFSEPEENYTKLPNELINFIGTMCESELKIILYIVRHTWGFHQDERHISLDEFSNGRKRKDGSRMDNGTGLTIKSIRYGIQKAQKHGYLNCERDETDKARIGIYYTLVRSNKTDCYKVIPGLIQSNTRTDTKYQADCYKVIPRLIQSNTQTDTKYQAGCYKVSVDHRKKLIKETNNKEIKKDGAENRTVEVSEKQPSSSLSRLRANSHPKQPNPAMHHLVEHFKNKCLRELKFTPDVAPSAYRHAKNMIKTHIEVELLACIDFFITSEKCAWQRENQGVTFINALSSKTITLYRASLSPGGSGSKLPKNITPEPGKYDHLGTKV